MSLILVYYSHFCIWKKYLKNAAKNSISRINESKIVNFVENLFISAIFQKYFFGYLSDKQKKNDDVVILMQNVYAAK